MGTKQNLNRVALGIRTKKGGKKYPKPTISPIRVFFSSLFQLPVSFQEKSQVTEVGWEDHQCQIHLGIPANNGDSWTPSKPRLNWNLYGEGPRELAL